MGRFLDFTIMSFFICGNDDRLFPRLAMQFLPFTHEVDFLPNCSIIYHVCEEHKYTNIANKHSAIRVGDISFYSLDEGILIVSSNIYVLVDNSYDVIDVFLSPQASFVQMKVAFLLLQGYRYILAKKGYFQMHSAVVIDNGVGIAFCGLSGAGKSTQAQLWEKFRNSVSLNLDQPVIIFKDNTVFVSGSPWSGKEDCYKTDVFPLKAVFFVEQSQRNYTEKLTIGEAFSHIYLHNYIVPVRDEFERIHRDSVEKFVLGVPVYRLQCNISEEAVTVAYDTVFKN